MPKLIRFDLVRYRRPRANYAHVTRQHIQKLWHFIETRASQEFSNARDSWIGQQLVSRLRVVTEVRFSTTGNKRLLVITVNLRVGPSLHRSKLVEQEQPPIHAHAFLRIKHRPFRIQLDQQRYQQPQRQEQHDRERRNNQVESALQNARAIREWFTKETN